MKQTSYAEMKLDINSIVSSHEGLVRRIAFKMHAKVSSFIELDDLLQSGLEGLVDACWMHFGLIWGVCFYQNGDQSRTRCCP